MRKEVEINGKWYWELEATDVNQVFNPPKPAFMWVVEIRNAKETELLFIYPENSYDRKYITTNLVGYQHCALLSSEHEKKSRRCTTLELAKWCDQNGFWINAEGVAVTKTSFFYETRNDECDGNLISICTWDGKPMEPTAKNMGLEE